MSFSSTNSQFRVRSPPPPQPASDFAFPASTSSESAFQQRGTTTLHRTTNNLTITRKVGRETSNVHDNAGIHGNAGPVKISTYMLGEHVTAPLEERATQQFQHQNTAHNNNNNHTPQQLQQQQQQPQSLALSYRSQSPSPTPVMFIQSRSLKPPSGAVNVTAGHAFSNYAQPQQPQQQQEQLQDPYSQSHAPQEQQALPPSQVPPKPLRSALRKGRVTASISAPVSPTSNFHRPIHDITTPIGASSSMSFPAPSMVMDDQEDWRRHGSSLRARLLLEDEKRGGATFSLHDECPIERYYKVADKVLEQFLTSVGTISSTATTAMDELSEAYLIGHRLVKFMSLVLPGHAEYYVPKYANLRNMSVEQLVELREYLDELALLIDEHQYNRYILKDLTPLQKSAPNGVVPVPSTPPASTPPASTPPASKMDWQVPTMQARDVPATVDVSSAKKRSTVQRSTSKERPNLAVNESMNNEPIRYSLTTQPSSTMSVTSMASGRESLEERVARVVHHNEVFGTRSTTPTRREPWPVVSSPTGSSHYARPPLPIPPSTPRKSPPASHPGGRILRNGTATTSPTNGSSAIPTRGFSVDDMSWDASFSEFDKVEIRNAQITEDAPKLSAPQSWIGLEWDTELRTPSKLKDAFSSKKPAINPSPASTATTQSTAGTHDLPSPETTSSIPKIREPPAVPSRSARAQAAAASGFDEAYTQSIAKNSNGTTQNRLNPTAMTWSAPAAMADSDPVQEEKKSSDADDAQAHFPTRIEQRLAKAQGLRGSNLDSFEDDDAHSIFDYGTGTDYEQRSRNSMANKSLLRHFKGCVQCLLVD